MNKFKERLSLLKTVYKRDATKIIEIDNKIRTLRFKESSLELEIGRYKESIKRFQHLADITNRDIKEQVEQSINKGLQKAFPSDNYEIKLEEYKHGDTIMLQVRLREGPDKTFKLLKNNGKAISMIISLIFTLYLGINSDGLKLYAFDEMLGGVDEFRADVVMDIITTFAKEYGLTILLVEHGLFPSIAVEKEGIEMINLSKIDDRQIIEVN